MTLDEILKRIIAKTGIADDREIPGLARIEWYPGPWSEGQPTTVFKHGEKLPLNPVMHIFRMFEDDLEFRVYALHVLDASKPPPSQQMPPTCYHVAKANRVYSAYSMSLPFWEDEIADELKVVAGLEGPNEDDDDPDEDPDDAPQGQVVEGSKPLAPTPLGPSASSGVPATAVAE